MNHPGPWKYGGAPGEITDSNGDVVVLSSDPETGASATVDDDAERLILAAPVLLEGMRALLSDDAPRDVTPFNLLVDYLDGKPGTNQIDLGEFLKWLRTGRGAVVTTDYRDVEGECDELLASLKSVLEVAESEFSSEFDGTGRIEPKSFGNARALIERIEKGST